MNNFLVEWRISFCCFVFPILITRSWSVHFSRQGFLTFDDGLCERRMGKRSHACLSAYIIDFSLCYRLSFNPHFLENILEKKWRYLNDITRCGQMYCRLRTHDKVCVGSVSFSFTYFRMRDIMLSNTQVIF